MALIACAFGCAEKRKPMALTARSRVSWEQVAVRRIERPQSGYKLITPTRGLFPAAMAVTRIAIEPDDEALGASAQPTLLTDPRNEFLRWNSTLDNQMAVSEVFPIAQRDLGGSSTSPDQILAAFQALHAGLGLIYAFNEVTETESEMFGVLYDVRAVTPIAALHTRAISLPPPPGQDRESMDLWKSDSRAIVRSQFEDLLHDCVHDLIVADEPGTLESPSGWIPEGPLRPVEWPPKRFRTGR